MILYVVLVVFFRPGLEPGCSWWVQGFSSYFWHIPESVPFIVHHHPIRDPDVKLCLLDPLLANRFGSQDHQREYISLHALNLL